MKKTILVKSALALAIAAATSAPTFAQMTEPTPEVTGVTGRYRVLVQCENGCELADTSGQFSMNASEELGNGNTIFGSYNFRVKADTGVLQTEAREAYVGIRGNFGDFSMGRRTGPFASTITSPVDWSSGFGGTWIAGINKGVGGQDKSIFYNIGGLRSMVTVFKDNPRNKNIELGYTHAFGDIINVGVAGTFPGKNKEFPKKDVERIYGLNVNGDIGGVRASASFYKKDKASSVLAQAIAPVGSGKLTFSIGKERVTKRSMLAFEYEQPLSANSSWFIGVEKYDVKGPAAIEAVTEVVAVPGNAGTAAVVAVPAGPSTVENTRFGIGLNFNFN